MRIKRQRKLGTDEARRRVDRIATEMGQQFGLSSEWRGDHLNVKGSGVDGQISVRDASIDVSVTLGFSLMLMEGTIRSAIEDAMDKHLV